MSLSARLLSLLAALAAFLRDVLSPPRCAACDAAVARQTVFCAACAATIVRVAPDAEGTLAFAAFGGAVADALKRFKYEERPDLARPLGHLVRRLVREAEVEAEIVVPIPLHPRRLAERGFNQSALLGRAAADELRIPFAARALMRVRDTPQQAKLPRAARHSNVSRAFSVRDAQRVKGLRVLLVDDVATTGATLSACRDALLEAGAASVVALCLLRAED